MVRVKFGDSVVAEVVGLVVVGREGIQLMVEEDESTRLGRQWHSKREKK